MVEDTIETKKVLVESDDIVASVIRLRDSIIDKHNRGVATSAEEEFAMKLNSCLYRKGFMEN